MTVTLPLSEVFGPTIQGEGPHTGIRCAFVRLGGCNLSCEWCDTPYTWDSTRYDVKAECPDTPVGRIHTRLGTMGVDTVVLSGGEPLIHHQRLRDLLRTSWAWHVETNGTIPPPPWWGSYVAHTTVSPKVITQSDPAKKRIKPAVLRAWNDHPDVVFKFVAAVSTDVDDIAKLAGDIGIHPSRIWVMPEGTDPDTVITRHRILAPAAVDHGFNTTTRLHTLLWGNERGH